MNLTLMYALQALNAIPTLIATGQNVMGMVNRTTVAMQNMQAENRNPTDQEWADLHKDIDAMRNQLHAS